MTYRHISPGELGAPRGWRTTGGSAGSEYLRATLNSAVFPDLWDIRSQL